MGFSQRSLENFIAQTMTVAEGRTFSLKHINIIKYNMLLGPIDSGMLIVGSKRYWDIYNKEHCSQNYYTRTEQYSYKLAKQGEAIYLPYVYNLSFKNNKYDLKFRRKFCIEKDATYSEVEQFPYLMDAFDKLNQNAIKLGSFDNNVIEDTLNEFKTNCNLKKSQLKVTPKQLEKSIFKQLNGK